ncbi:MAG TPA: esterase-like activity of phytase family protein [Polyangiaceae bacterium]|nr:esterase-like activity of phytase family protein [Polyangiaceae bacterium]
MTSRPTPSRSKHSRSFGLLLLATAAGFAACGDDDDTPSDTPAAGTGGRGGSGGAGGSSSGAAGSGGVGGSSSGAAGSGGAGGMGSGAAGAGGAAGSGGAGGSAGGQGGASQGVSLTFLDDLNFGTPAGAGGQGGAGGQAGPGTKYPFGGLSGTFYDAAGKTIYAISDSRGAPATGPVRLYPLPLQLDAGQVGVTIDDEKAVLLRNPAGELFAANSIDPEGIAPAPGGGFYVSSEGEVSPAQVLAPAIFRAAPDGSYVGALPVPARYLPDAAGAQQTTGVRNNGAFECLATTPDARYLFACNEVPVVQDGAPADYGQGGVVRVLRYGLAADGTATPGAEFAYELEPVPGADPGPKPDGTPRFRVSGLVDLLPIDETRLLAMERATGEDAQGVFNNFVKIFEVSLAGAADVAGLNVTPAGAARASKRLVLDVNAIVAQFEPGFQSVDNFEGLTFGPTLPSNKRSLLVVSDNNFSATQRTAFLAFEVDGLPPAP